MLIDAKELERRLNSGRNLSNKLRSEPPVALPTASPMAPVSERVPSAGAAIADIPQDVPLDNTDEALRPSIERVPLPDAKISFHPREGNEALRELAGTLARSGQPVRQVAEDLGMTPNQVQGAAKSPKLQAKIEANLNRVREMALDKMMEAMGLMDEDKFANASLKDLAQTTAALSRVIDKTAPKESGPTVQLIVYAPDQKKLRDFDVVDI